MLILGLTGGIACGKSHVASVLAAMGCRVLDGDRIARTLTAPDGAALPDIRAAFGAGMLDANGALNRKALGQLIFHDPAARAKLDAIMQPLIRSRIEAALREKTEAVTVLEMPLLFEQQLDRLCDRVWCVSLPENKQLSRLMLRDGLTEQQAMERIRSQLPLADKRMRSDVVIDTSGTHDMTADAVRLLLANEQKLWLERIPHE